MSKRGARASLMAYVSAEEHLLNCYSPLAAGDDVTVGPSAGPPDARAGVVVSEELPEDSIPALPPSPQYLGSDLDPAVDSMLHVITDDSDIHSLISCDFKGWEEQHASTSFLCEREPFIYGLSRSMMPTAEEVDAEAPPDWANCTPVKRPCSSQEVIEINDSPEAVREPSIALMHPGVMLTNGTIAEHFPLEGDAYEGDLQVTGEGIQPCVLYETVDGENMVVLAEEHCCEIIVATQGVASEQEFARAIIMAGNGSSGTLLGLLPEQRLDVDELNGAAYMQAEMMDEDGEARVAAGNNVYLSDAALEQPLVHHQHHQELVEEEENENATFVDDTPMEEERPDICEVYEHELEDHDRDEENEECILQHAAPVEPLVITEVDQEEEPPLHQVSKKLLREHSSPTEFPVSSSSMPNASYNYDYDDDLMVGHTPLKRKYPPLMKNTLYAEAMDRRLASICQAQPQMSPAEKVSSWETAVSNECAVVEDVESFQAEFERHEATAAPLKQHSFVEFRETLVRNLEKISREIMQVSDESTQEQASSQSAERPVYHRRLLHVMPTEETIVLDDDDDEDDCYEVMDMDKASVTTLIPEDELPEDELQADQPPEGDEVVLHIDATDQRHNAKETSTTDLDSSAAEPTATSSAPPLDRMVTPLPSAPPPLHCCASAPAYVPEGSTHLMEPAPEPTDSNLQLSSVVLDVMRQRVQMHKQQLMEQQMHQQQQQQQPHQHMYRYQELPQSPQGKHSMEMPMQMPGDQEARYLNCPTMFYEQQEFCNYLGLTELATANAVATAMRELANSTVARRSLRVRPQHQLDRMRSDVRGKRRERERQQQQDKDKKQPVATPSSSEPSTSDREDIQQPEGGPGADAELNYACQQPATMAEEDGLPYGYYYQGQGDHPEKREPLPDQERCKSFEEQESHRSPNQRKQSESPCLQESHRPSIGHEELEEDKEQQQQEQEGDTQRARSVESAFAKIYEAAAPAQSKLLQSMQQRLRQARETKPSIYIIQATNNAPVPPTPSTPKQQSPAQLFVDGLGEIGAPRPSAVILSPVRASPVKAALPKSAPMPALAPLGLARPPTRSPLGPARPPTRSPLGPARPPTRSPKAAAKQRKEPTATKRRRTTMGTTSPAKQARIRDLVTRSTTHLNSKLLRNRKVNLLKSYALSDEMAKGRKRLTGGISTPHGGKKGPMSRMDREAGMKRPKDPAKKKLPTQHRLQEQVQAPPNSPRKLMKHGTAMPTTSVQKPPPSIRLTKRTKRSRTKSLPATFEMVPVPLQGTAPPPTLRAVRGIDGSRLETPMVMTKTAVVEASQTHLHAHSASPAPTPYAKPVQEYPPLPTTPPLDPSRATEPLHRHGLLSAGLSINSTPPGGLIRLSEGSCPLSNPLSQKHGKVLYIFYELEQLIVLQETCITFWKFSKVLNVLNKPRPTTSPLPASIARKSPAPQQHTLQRQQQEQEVDVSLRWVYLGRLRRITNDTEIFTPYGSRICVHNSTPVYLEMQSRSLEHHKREVKLTSLHVNVYYYCEEEMRPRMHSVHLDTVNCEGSHVIYTSIADSRYFVMAWQQELVMGKPRSGICKYSLMPTLDTLASIREFKQLRHELRHIECLSEDRLIGYGQTRVTVWDHRSGDTLMNYDLGRPLGRSLAAMHYPSLDLDQSSMLILYQYFKEKKKPAEVHVIACELSHATPSHRLLQIHRLPSPLFDEADAIEAVNTGDHLIIKSALDDEAWINAADPRQLTYVAPLANGAQRFYARNKSQVIEMSPESLTVESITNHMLKLAVQQQLHQYHNQMPVWRERGES